MDHGLVSVFWDPEVVLDIMPLSILFNFFFRPAFLGWDMFKAANSNLTSTDALPLKHDFFVITKPSTFSVFGKDRLREMPGDSSETQADLFVDTVDPSPDGRYRKMASIVVDCGRRQYRLLSFNLLAELQEQFAYFRIRGLRSS